MYFVITENTIYRNNTLKGLNRKMKSAMEQEEFVSVGKDFIIQLSNTDIQFVQDKKRLQSVAINKLFKKSNTDKIILVIILIISAVTMIRG